MVERFHKKIELLKTNPKMFKHLKYKLNLWEMQLGDNYRVLYKIIDKTVVVYILELLDHDSTERFIRDYKE